MFHAIPQNRSCASKTHRVSKYMLVHETFDLYILLISVFETTAMLNFSNIQYFPLAPFDRFIGSLMRL